MAKVYTANEVQALLDAGKGEADIPAGAIITPAGRDVLRSGGIQATRSTAPTAKVAKAAEPATPPIPTVPDYEYRWAPGSDAKAPADIQAFFNSEPMMVLKRRMVDIGRRMWERDYTDGNGGNLTIRVGDNLVLCTPTLISKGFMTVEDICLVDMDGNQLAGKRKRTSECMTHLGIMKRQPKAKACCHAHPPHATAFAVAKVRPPSCLIPEAEVFLGQIGMAPYQTPGTPANADVVGTAAVENMAVLMENHGVITWGKDIEDAYWKMENTDAYCRTIWVASQLGKELTPITGQQAKELIALRQSLGMEDKRADWKECELCDNSEFRPGFASVPLGNACAIPAPAQPAKYDGQAESVVKMITDQILAQLGGR
ncbi:MAG: class II aldolase/adducin family protein [Verrucomicrobiota bacterium JB022]|nr:class II aldolase/adducin family protein [Verrucomicrobiota bacterium JB022]